MERANVDVPTGVSERSNKEREVHRVVGDKRRKSALEIIAL